LVCRYFSAVWMKGDPAPAVGSGQPHPALKQIDRRLIAHAAAGTDVLVGSVVLGRAGVDQNDLERLEVVIDAAEFCLHVMGARHVSVGEVTEIKFHTRLKAPFLRDLVDCQRSLAAVHGRMEMIRRIKVGAIVGAQLHGLNRPGLTIRQLFLLDAREEAREVRKGLPMIDIGDVRLHGRRIGRDGVFEVDREIDEPARHAASSERFA
jgi:hypothetical protein